MSYIGPLIAASFPPLTGPPRWITRRITPLLQNEGDSATFETECINGVPGKTSLIWKIASSSGGLGGPSAWALSWHDLWEEECARHGATWTRMNGSSVNATFAGRIDLTSAWDSLPMRVTNLCRLDKRTNISTSTPTNPGIRQMFLQQEIPAGSLGSIQAGNGIPVQMRDISLTPAGTPTITLKAYGADGSALPATILEGAKLSLQLETANIIAGTVVRIYAANQGHNKFTEPFKNAAVRGATAAKCSTYSYTNPNVGPDTGNPARAFGVGYFDGILITYEPEYSNGSPVRIDLEVAQYDDLDGPRQVDFIAQVLAEGDPNNPVQAGAMIVSRQILLKARTPSFWQIEAKRDGATLRYALRSLTGASDASVNLASTGDEPAGFWAALDAAVAASGGTMARSGAALTSTAAWNGALEWSVANPGGAGKHVLALSGATGTSRIRVMDACVWFTQPALAPLTAFARGVNLSGGEFGNTRPGVYAGGTAAGNYRYPANPEFVDNPQYEALDYWIAKGCKVIRLPVLWERIQRAPFGPLYPDTPAPAAFLKGDAQDIHRVDDFIANANVRGAAVILDVHNYAKAWGENISVNAATTTPAAFYDLWERLANRYAGNPLVWFGVMNEPNGYLAADWKDYAQGVVNAIRARTPALNRILVPGTSYTGAHSWVSSGNAEAMETFYDPAGNSVFEVHQYFDSDSSGTKGVCSLNSRFRLNAATAWARGRGVQLFLGEFMGGNPTVEGQEQCGTEVPAMCAYMDANRDVWAGWTGWGAGWGWPSYYQFKLDPASYTNPIDTPQFGMIQPYLTN